MWVDNIDPVLLHIYGNFGIRWYSLAYILGLLLGYYWLKHLSKESVLVLTKKELDDFIFYLALGLILGARIGYVIFYNFSDYLHHPLEILKVWHGGMSFHGGAIGVVLATYLFSKKLKKDMWMLLGAISIVAPIGLFFGRIANFINGELWGKPTDGTWGVIFPNADMIPRHPSQLYEAFLEGLLLFLILYVIYKKKGNLFYISPFFGMGYAIFRFIVEFFREPDTQLGYILFNTFSMGQLLSMLMFLLSFYLYIFIRRKYG